MKIVIITESTTTTNLIRAALASKNVTNVELFEYRNATQLSSAAVPAGCIVLVDWEYSEVEGPALVASIQAANESAPIMLLCVKAKAATTFSGMKAGAIGIIYKPIDADELLRGLATAIRRMQANRKTTVNVEFINPFIDATRNVFQTMCNIVVERKKVFLKEDYKMLGDVSGVMGLTGAATGTVVVSFPERLACEVVAKMLGEQTIPKKLTPDICDGVGEVINMIAGQAKAMLAQTKYAFTISIPSVVSGAGHEVNHKKGTPNLVVLFATADGEEFALQVCLAPTADPSVFA